MYTILLSSLYRILSYIYPSCLGEDNNSNADVSVFIVCKAVVASVYCAEYRIEFNKS